MGPKAGRPCPLDWNLMEALFRTVQNRPYVVVFLLTFLILATLHFGILRALIWLVLGYGIAFLSEYSSVHNGFPYGLYHYIPEAFEGELALAGIPLWDSASYAFIAYASYSLAWFLIEPSFLRYSIDPHLSPSRPFAVISLASLLMTLSDGIIDPAANLGEQWFLGKIYYYPEGGSYFGVPLTNFLGWFLVAFVILGAFQVLEKFILSPARLPAWGAKRFPLQGILGPLFYFGILGFILCVITSIKAYPLLLASGLITAFPLFLVALRIARRKS